MTIRATTCSSGTTFFNGSRASDQQNDHVSTRRRRIVVAGRTDTRPRSLIDSSRVDRADTAASATTAIGTAEWISGRGGVGSFRSRRGRRGHHVTERPRNLVVHGRREVPCTWLTSPGESPSRPATPTPTQYQRPAGGPVGERPSGR